jgi:uncharacterized protein (TIGR01777 family)
MFEMEIAVTGSHGLVGSALVQYLVAGGHRVTRIIRGGDAAEPFARWSVERGVEDPARLAGLDAVVHLAGENLAAGRWTRARKAEIRRSRVLGTERLAAALATLERPPRVFIGASAIGIYGDRGDEPLDEQSAPGRGFLADLCREWEGAAEALRTAGVRVVHLRFGVVLTPAGGALEKMLPAFRLGAGAVVGSGRQVMSWIVRDDVLGAILHGIRTDSLTGPVNAVAPAPVTNTEFTRILARVLGRPAVLKLPAFALRLALGELADQALLASQRVVPGRLLATGYRFRHGELEPALRHLLGR